VAFIFAFGQPMLLGEPSVVGLELLIFNEEFINVSTLKKKRRI
jgi:hypothetical protein